MRAINDKKDIDMELIALKKNFTNLRTDLDKEKIKNENLGVELINLVNENKVVQRDLFAKEQVSGEVS